MSLDKSINLLETSSLSRLKFWYEQIEKEKPQSLTEFDRKLYDRIVELLGIKPATI